MVRRYPHTVTVTIAGTATLNGSGNWTPGAPITVQGACSFQSNTRNLLVRAQDGTQVVYDGIVYTRRATAAIPLGSEVQVLSEEGEVIAKGTAKQVIKGPFNTRIWL